MERPEFKDHVTGIRYSWMRVQPGTCGAPEASPFCRLTDEERVQIKESYPEIEVNDLYYFLWARLRNVVDTAEYYGKKIEQSMSRFLCQKCNEFEAMHTTTVGATGHRLLCCRCYVVSGQSPADWHPACMDWYALFKRGLLDENGRPVPAHWKDKPPKPVTHHGKYPSNPDRDGDLVPRPACGQLRVGDSVNIAVGDVTCPQCRTIIIDEQRRRLMPGVMPGIKIDVAAGTTEMMSSTPREMDFEVKCTCSIQDLVARGCACGAFRKESGQ
jgi:hypothetical protein